MGFLIHDFILISLRVIFLGITVWPLAAISPGTDRGSRKRPLQRRPRPLIGFSDNTALHLAAYRHGIVTFHGPHAAALELADFSLDTLRLVLGPGLPEGPLAFPEGHSGVQIVRGGGIEWTIKDGIPYHVPTLLREVREIVADYFDQLDKLEPENDDQKAGIDIVRRALQIPARQIAINAGEDGSVVVGKVLEKDQYAFGYDAQNGEYVNLVSKGIIDPTKVVRTALQNASSIASLLLTTEALVSEIPEEKKEAPAGPGGGGMGGMY